MLLIVIMFLFFILIYTLPQNKQSTIYGGLDTLKVDARCMWFGNANDAARMNLKFRLSPAIPWGLDASSGILCVRYEQPCDQLIINVYNQKKQFFNKFAGFLHIQSANVLYSFYNNVTRQVAINDEQQIALFKCSSVTMPDGYIVSEIQTFNYERIKNFSVITRFKQIQKDPPMQCLGIQNIAHNQCFFNATVQMALRMEGLSQSTHPDLKWLRLFQQYMITGDFKIHKQAQDELRSSRFLNHDFLDDRIDNAKKPVNLGVQSDPTLIFGRIFSICEYQYINPRSTVRFVPVSCPGECGITTMMDPDFLSGTADNFNEFFKQSYSKSYCGTVHEWRMIIVARQKYIHFSTPDGTKQLQFNSIKDMKVGAINYSLRAIIVHLGAHYIAIVAKDDHYVYISDSNTNNMTESDVLNYIGQPNNHITDLLFELS